MPGFIWPILRTPSSPTWSAMMDGQVNLKDATSGTIEFTNEIGKKYQLADRTATLIVRPRGLHLKEKGFLADGSPVPAALIDFGLFFSQWQKDV